VDNLWKLNVVLREYLALGWYNVIKRAMLAYWHDRYAGMLG